jgi:cellulose synthase/poly-beta-1,6-N-acetylglucosamine synthase-like glycosyltransferase
LEGERARVEAERGAGKVAVIIPTYNEAENVVRVLRSTTAALTGPLSW